MNMMMNVVAISNKSDGWRDNIQNMMPTINLTGKKAPDFNHDATAAAISIL